MSEKRQTRWLAAVKRADKPYRIFRVRSSENPGTIRQQFNDGGYSVLRLTRETEVTELDVVSLATEGRLEALRAVDDWAAHLWRGGDVEVLLNWIAYYSNPNNPKATDFDAQEIIYSKAQQVARVALGGVRREWQLTQGVNVNL